MRWADTVLYQSIVNEIEAHDRPKGHGADVLPRNGVVGALIFVVALVALLSSLFSRVGFLQIAAGPVAVVVLLFTRAIAGPFIEGRQRRINDATSGADLLRSSFVFYLRPFAGDGKRPITTQRSSGTVTLLFGLEADFEFMLSHALRWTFPVVGLGRNEQSRGAARVMIEDDEWRDLVIALSQQSATIVFVPGVTEGSLWELIQLRSRPDLLRKTLFVMPPRLGMRVQRFIPEVFQRRTQKHWEAARATCAELDMRLPAYKPSGGFFWMRADGEVEREFPAWAFDPARVETICVATSLRKAGAGSDGLEMLEQDRPRIQQFFAATILNRQILPVSIWFGAAAVLLDAMMSLG